MNTPKRVQMETKKDRVCGKLKTKHLKKQQYIAHDHKNATRYQINTKNSIGGWLLSYIKDDETSRQMIGN